jgi:hypothetical protein
MKAAALARGIELTLIDYGRSLSEQGRFDAIIHKLRPNPGAAQAAMVPRFTWVLAFVTKPDPLNPQPCPALQQHRTT